MHLIIFSIRQQWNYNLLQKSFDDNPLALQHRRIIHRNSKAKEVPAHVPPNFSNAPDYSLAINRKPEKILHIL